MTSPKLVFVVTEDWYFVSHRLPLAVAAREAGFDVTVLTRCSGAHRAIEAAGVGVMPFAMNRRGLNPLGLLRETWALARIYRRLRPDIVHHVALRPVVVGGLAARLAGVPAVVSAVAGMGYLFTDARRVWLAAIMRRLLRFVLARGRVIVQNPDDFAALAALTGAPSRIRLIPGAGVDVETFSPAAPPAGPVCIVLAARMLWDKGVGEFVAAAEMLASEGIEARFLLAGAPDPDNPAAVPEATLRSWHGRWGVEWIGHQADMAALYRSAHIACLPSYYREGLPKSLLEAAACGLPIVTTDAPGCREVVRDGVNGLLVPVRDAGALAAALRILIGDAALRRRMGEQSRLRAETEFGLEAVIAQTLAGYREVCA